MKVEQWPVDKPQPYANNARQITTEAVAKVALSLKEYGWQQPIVVDEQGVIIAGHTRLMAAEKLGLKEVPVHVATGLTDEQVRAYRLMDNRSHQESRWDFDLLKIELGELADLNVDLNLTGFDPKELTDFLCGNDLDEPSEGVSDIEGFHVLCVFKSESAQEEFFGEMQQRGIACKLMT